MEGVVGARARSYALIIWDGPEAYYIDYPVLLASARFQRPFIPVPLHSGRSYDADHRHSHCLGVHEGCFWSHLLAQARSKRHELVVWLAIDLQLCCDEGKQPRVQFYDGSMMG